MFMANMNYVNINIKIFLKPNLRCITNKIL